MLHAVEHRSEIRVPNKRQHIHLIGRPFAKITPNALVNRPLGLLTERITPPKNGVPSRTRRKKRWGGGILEVYVNIRQKRYWYG